MFQLTEFAAQVLGKIKSDVQQQQPGTVLRLVRAGETKFKFVIDAPAEGDQELYSTDDKVLVVDPEISGLLADVTLDCQETPQGHEFVFQRRTA
ncbi:MAG: hypothetical protein ACE5JI_20060 [Acidobacteriota bacterium]